MSEAEPAGGGEAAAESAPDRGQDIDAQESQADGKSKTDKSESDDSSESERMSCLLGSRRRSSMLPTVAPASAAESQKSCFTIFLKATANAPIMKKRKWLVEPDKSVASINQFIRKLLHLDENDSLFLYVNQSFAPSPDQTIRNLYNCFETDGKLILHYCTTQAWG